jgi:hypothetical protein
MCSGVDVVEFKIPQLTLEDFTLLSQSSGQKEAEASFDDKNSSEFHFENEQRSLDEVANAYVFFVYNQVNEEHFSFLFSK